MEEVEATYTPFRNLGQAFKRAHEMGLVCETAARIECYETRVPKPHFSVVVLLDYQLVSDDPQLRYARAPVAKFVFDGLASEEYAGMVKMAKRAVPQSKSDPLGYARRAHMGQLMMGHPGAVLILRDDFALGALLDSDLTRIGTDKADQLSSLFSVPIYQGERSLKGPNSQLTAAEIAGMVDETTGQDRTLITVEQLEKGQALGKHPNRK